MLKEITLNKIYAVNKSSTTITSLKVDTFENESEIQKLIANCPEVLSGEQMDQETPIEYLLVGAEVDIPNSSSKNSNWKLDHLFIDQYGKPTFVEVKRHDNPEINRKVVGQILEYTANAIAFWSPDFIESQLKERCQADDLDIDEVIKEHSGKSVEDFMALVSENLEASKIRILIVGEQIPIRLETTLEFLNKNMPKVEVIALEIQRYTHNNEQIIVPKIVGATDAAKAKAKIELSEEEKHEMFFKTLEAQDKDKADFCRRVLTWADDRGMDYWYGSNSIVPKLPVVGHSVPAHIYYMRSTGVIEIMLKHLQKKPPFNSREAVIELLVPFSEHISEDTTNPKIDMSVFMEDEVRAREIFDFYFDTITEYAKNN